MSDQAGAPIIVWFEQDLRLSDHPALSAAAATGRPVIPVFILDTRPVDQFSPGAASRWWLHGSLQQLGGALRAMDSRLVLRRGDPALVLRALCAESGANAIYWNRRPERQADRRDDVIARDLSAQSLSVNRYDAALLYGVDAVLTSGGQPFKVFTPFWRECLRVGEPALPEPAPDLLHAPAVWPVSERLEDWALRPTRPDWAGGLRQSWQPGEVGAWARLDRFLDARVEHYRDSRDRPDQDATSRLAPHLRWGEISARQVWHATRLRTGDPNGSVVGSVAEPFLRQLGWRDFSYRQLLRQPHLRTYPLDERFAAFPWSEDRAALRQWQQGQTGFPIVDAAMRQLWQIGWMHNRLRMIVGSFLVKDLLLPWQHGEAWFWDTLVDADPWNNAAGWQWIAGCGADAAPYFRVFNPVLQARKFDPNGVFVRRYVPELAALPAAYIHEPWSAPQTWLRQAGVRLGQTYPLPMVDHKEARQRALAAFNQIKVS